MLEYMLIIAVVACGLVGSSRLMLKAHEPADIYGGYFIGFLSQFVALNILYTAPEDDFSAMLSSLP